MVSVENEQLETKQDKQGEWKSMCISCDFLGAGWWSEALSLFTESVDCQSLCYFPKKLYTCFGMTAIVVI